MIPFDPRPPAETSGIRLGTPALTTRGMKEPQMQQVADWIDFLLTSHEHHGRNPARQGPGPAAPAASSPSRP